MYVFAYIYTCIFLRIRKYIFNIYSYTYMYTYMLCIFIHIYIISIYICIDIYTYAHAFKYIHVYIYILCRYPFVCVYALVHPYIHFTRMEIEILLCKSVCAGRPHPKYICDIYSYIHIYIYIHTHP